MRLIVCLQCLKMMMGVTDMAKRKKTNYGMALRAYMGITGLSVVELAGMTGKSKSMISYLRNHASWSEENTASICCATGIRKEQFEDIYRSLPGWIK